MRKQFVSTSLSLLENDPSTVFLLGDIGVFGFRDALNRYPSRVFNIGILEPSTVSLAAGLAKEGFTPFVHTIAPFLVERSYEQLKVDFAYQGLGGNFVSVGASYDYASLGCTHHCPGDVSVLKAIPSMEIVVPGTAQEFDTLIRESYRNGNPTYFRLSERTNNATHATRFGKAEVLRQGNAGTILAVGPMLDHVLAAAEGLDVTIIYYTTVRPFDSAAFRETLSTPKVAIVASLYQGTLSDDLIESMGARPLSLRSIGIPTSFLRNYGRAEEHDEALGLTASGIRAQLWQFFNV